LQGIILKTGMIKLFFLKVGESLQQIVNQTHSCIMRNMPDYYGFKIADLISNISILPEKLLMFTDFSTIIFFLFISGIISVPSNSIC
jgi:hypothetical protein